MNKVLCGLLILCLASLGHIALCNVILCEGQWGYLTCPSGQRLYIESAIYGRSIDGSICPHPSIQTTSCRSSVSDQIVKSKCNGTNRCKIEANYKVYGDPCVNTYKYLDVSYKCL